MCIKLTGTFSVQRDGKFQYMYVCMYILYMQQHKFILYCIMQYIYHCIVILKWQYVDTDTPKLCVCDTYIHAVYV